VVAPKGSIPPPIMAMNLAMVQYSKTNEFEQRQKLLVDNCIYVHERFKKANIPNTAYPEIPLKFVHTGSINNMKMVVLRMRDLGFSVFPMFYPAVPKGHAGVRIAITAKHTNEMLSSMCDAIESMAQEHLLVPFETRIMDPFYQS
jgi:7-keto-8-aminopelargonate synthetase-like enzyme